ncbi:MAG: 2-phospho-L-lactate guanylyltransferase [bacterium]|nr:2-phospho-L-lactate guanylyltransferase [bacterium]
MSPQSAAVLIPVKAFKEAKHRLAPALGASERAELARDMATHVVRSAAPLPAAVVCDDRVVREWADSVGAAVVWRPGTGLNAAVRSGVDHLQAAGYERVIVAHGDLPRAGSLAPLGDWPGVTLVPDRRNDGTNVIALPSDCPFEFSYGKGSFSRHFAQAQRLGRSLRVLRDPAFGLDIDLPADLEELAVRS